MKDYWVDEDEKPEYVEALDGQLERAPAFGVIHHPAPRTRTVVVDLDDELPYPDRAKVVAEAKAEGDRYRAISRRYAGLT